MGSPLELYNNPDTLFVAGFIGSPKMNILSGKAAADHGAPTIGIRPEHIDIVADGAGAWPGRILLTEHLGADTFLHVDLATGDKLVVRAPGDFAGKPGDAVALKPQVPRIHRFDAAGKAIRA